MPRYPPCIKPVKLVEELAIVVEELAIVVEDLPILVVEDLPILVVVEATPVEEATQVASPMRPAHEPSPLPELASEVAQI